MGLWNKVFGTKEKTADEYLAKANEHALGTTTVEKGIGIGFGGVFAGVAAIFTYAGYRVSSFFNAVAHFIVESDKASFPVGQVLHRAPGQSYGDRFKDLFNGSREKFWTTHSTSTATQSSALTAAPHSIPKINVDLETPTALGKAFMRAEAAWKDMNRMFSKESIGSLFKNNPVIAFAIVSVAVLTGGLVTLSSWHKHQRKHDQKVADNFKAALRLDNSQLVEEIKDISKGNPISLEQARSIARDHNDIVSGLIPESKRLLQKVAVEKEPSTSLVAEKRNHVGVVADAQHHSMAQQT